MNLCMSPYHTLPSTLIGNVELREWKGDTNFEISVLITSLMTEILTSAEESTCLAPRLLARMHWDIGDDDDDDDATPPAMPSKLDIIFADFSQTSTAQRNPLNFSTSLNSSSFHYHCRRNSSDMWNFFVPQFIDSSPSPEWSTTINCQRTQCHCGDKTKPLGCSSSAIEKVTRGWMEDADWLLEDGVRCQGGNSPFQNTCF